MTPDKPQQTILPQTPNAPTPPPVFASSPLGKKPKAQTPQATFLGSGSGNPPNNPQMPTKTLIGA